MKSTCQCGRPSRLTHAEIKARAHTDMARACEQCAAIEAGGYDQYSAPVGRAERKRTGTSFATINARCEAALVRRGIITPPSPFTA